MSETRTYFLCISTIISLNTAIIKKKLQVTTQQIREKAYSVWTQKRRGKTAAQISIDTGFSKTRIYELVMQGERYERYRDRWREKQGLAVAPVSEAQWQGWVAKMLTAFADTFPSTK